MELCSVMCGSLAGRGRWGRVDTRICVTASLSWAPEALTMFNQLCSSIKLKVKKKFFKSLLSSLHCCHSDVAMSMLPWLWERLPRVRLWTIHGEMSSSHQNLPFCLLPRCTASFMAFPSLLYHEVWPGMPYQVWPELQPVELGKQDVCHLQAWPIKLSQGHCSFSAFSPVVKRREWITMALEGMIWHGLGHSSVGLTLELNYTVPVDVQGPSYFPG